MSASQHPSPPGAAPELLGRAGLSGRTDYPVVWTRTFLGALASYINGRAFGPEDWGSQGLPIIRIEQLLNPEAEADLFSGILHPANRIDTGDLVFSWSATLAVRRWDRGPAALNQHLFKVIPKTGVKDRFLHHLIEFHLEDLGGQSHGSTMRHIKRGDLADFQVCIPLEPEQARIAEVLDTLDEAIRGTELVVTRLETMRPGVLLQLVFPWLGDSEGCPPDLMKASRSLLFGRGQLPSVWEWMRLDSIAEVERGKFTYRPRNEPKLFGGRFPFIQTGDVVRALGREIDTASQWLNDMGMRFSREFPAGTIAVTIAANIADTAILGLPMCFPDSVVGVVVRKPHNNRFVELCIRVAKLGLEARAPQSAQKNINLQDLRPLWIPMPPPAVQDRIAVAYEDYESRIRGEVTKLGKLQALKSGLASDLLTGRVRTRPH